MKKVLRKNNKHLQEMLDHYESIIDSIQLDEKTTQMFTTLFIIASKVNDKTMNKVARDVDNYRKNEFQEEYEYLKSRNMLDIFEDFKYDNLFNFDEESEK